MSQFLKIFVLVDQIPKGGGTKHPSVPTVSSILQENNYMCGSGSSVNENEPRSNEIICTSLLNNGSDVIVVAPTMSSITSPSGEEDSRKVSIGHLDVTGRYFLFTSNLGGNKLHAIMVR